MAARRFFSRLIGGLVAALVAVGVTSAIAQTPRLLLQTVPLAGFAYHSGAKLWPQLREGDALILARDAGNPADILAVQVVWHGQLLGYLPRVENGPVALALERGTPLSARIAQLRESRNPRERILIEVFAELRAQ